MKIHAISSALIISSLVGKLGSEDGHFFGGGENRSDKTLGNILQATKALRKHRPDYMHVLDPKHPDFKETYKSFARQFGREFAKQYAQEAVQKSHEEFQQYLLKTSEAFKSLEYQTPWESGIRNWLDMYKAKKITADLTNSGGNIRCYENGYSAFCDYAEKESSFETLETGLTTKTINTKHNTYTFYLKVEDLPSDEVGTSDFISSKGSTGSMRVVEHGILKDDTYFPITHTVSTTMTHPVTKTAGTNIIHRSAVIPCSDVPVYSCEYTGNIGDKNQQSSIHIPDLRKSSDKVAETMDDLLVEMSLLPSSSETEFDELFSAFNFLLSSVFMYENDYGSMASRTILGNFVLELSHNSDMQYQYIQNDKFFNDNMAHNYFTGHFTDIVRPAV